MTTAHYCKQMGEATKKRADYAKPYAHEYVSFNGQAVDQIYMTTQGTWVATQVHLEYGTIIAYCPFCGVKLEE